MTNKQKINFYIFLSEIREIIISEVKFKHVLNNYINYSKHGKYEFNNKNQFRRYTTCDKK